MMKMVIVSLPSGAWHQGLKMPSGKTTPIGRLIIEGKKIKGEVLDSAILPEGHEKECLNYYKQFLKELLDPTFVHTAPKSKQTSVLETMYGPEENPEKWLTNLFQVFPQFVSDYKEFDEKKYKPIPDNFLTSLQKISKTKK